MTEIQNQSEKSESEFCLIKYCEFTELSIRNILLRPENDVLTFDILDTEKSKINKLIALHETQRQMKVGEIWQEVLGNYNGCVNLKIGHETGLDILSHTKKFAIELKNRTNTDNASSKKTNLDKLAKFTPFNISNADIIQLIFLNHPQNNILNPIGELLLIYFYLYFFLYNPQIHIQDLLKNYI